MKYLIFLLVLCGCTHSTGFYQRCDVSEADAFAYYTTERGNAIVGGLCWTGDLW